MGIDWQSLVVAPLVGVFGQPAEATPAAGGTFPLAGVFDEASTADYIVNGETVTITSPSFGFNVADLPVSLAQGDGLLVFADPTGAPQADTAYVVRDVRVDGHGWARAYLTLAP